MSSNKNIFIYLLTTNTKYKRIKQLHLDLKAAPNYLRSTNRSKLIN